MGCGRLPHADRTSSSTGGRGGCSGWMCTRVRPLGDGTEGRGWNGHVLLGMERREGDGTGTSFWPEEEARVGKCVVGRRTGGSQSRRSIAGGSAPSPGCSTPPPPPPPAAIREAIRAIAWYDRPCLPPPPPAPTLCWGVCGRSPMCDAHPRCDAHAAPQRQRRPKAVEEGTAAEPHDTPRGHNGPHGPWRTLGFSGAAGCERRRRRSQRRRRRRRRRRRGCGSGWRSSTHVARLCGDRLDLAGELLEVRL